MNNKRTYLDSLNAGRPRRPGNTIEEIGRTLDALGARLERPHDAQRRPSERAEMAYRSSCERPPASNYASAYETTRRQEEGMASVARIAGELKSMREELRDQMTAGLHHEFEALRADIERTWHAAASGMQGRDLQMELERLSDAVGSLAMRGDDRSMDLLRHELDQVRDAVARLASQESLQAVERRWDDFDRRFDAFEERLVPQANGSADAAIDALNARLEQIAGAVHALPESLSLRTLEDKVRTLAGAVDHFSRQQDMVAPSSFRLIEERLDEISRAIVASSVAAQTQSLSYDHFERIEARISALARQIDELADDRPTGEVIDRINALSMRVDDMARRAEFPEQAIARLAEHVSIIADKMDAGFTAPDADLVMRNLEERLNGLADAMQRQQGDNAQRGERILHEIEQRLDDLASRMEQPAAAPQPSPAFLDAIDRRFEELSHRFDRSVAAANGVAAAGDVAMRNLEDRLLDITTRLDQSARDAGIEPSLIRSLEAQVAGLSTHLASPGHQLPEFEDIAPRLAQMERTIASQRETIVETARLAAEQAIRAQGDSDGGSGAVAALAGDLKELDQLTRRSDERNARTFEAIHDTLIKIVDRLGTLETREAPATKLSIADAPPLEPAAPTAPIDGMHVQPTNAPMPKRSPAQAAHEAATAALADDGMEMPAPAAQAKASRFGGLARALTRQREVKATVEPEAPEPRLEAAPSVDIDEPIDPSLANRPLEPGSGAPDLNAIMKRVRDERGQAPKAAESDAAKADFIAAARRAAQAAAAEAETRKKGMDANGNSAGGIAGILRKHRKTALMAAGGVVIALAGLQLGRAFLNDNAPVAAIETPSAPVQVADLAPAPMSASEPAQDVAAIDPVRLAEPSASASGDLTDDEMEPDNEITSGLPEEMDLPEPAQAVAVATPDPAVAAEPISIPVGAGPVALREAAQAGDPKALFEIGSRYAEGRGTQQDMAAAATWYERAAEAGFAPGQYRIGNFYEKGTGVERNVDKAKTWYQMAAEQGNASAMHNLAVLFAMGADGTTDNESAGRWFTRAAELGVKDSQFNLAILSAKGIGVPQSLEESYKWFALVAKTGDKDAAQKRDEVANALRPEQLERARAAAELWKPKTLSPEANDITVPEGWTESDAKTASVDMKQAVRNIQLILNKNGYDAGSADGVMGGKTKSAIAAFQAANGMASTGEVTEDLIHALLSKK